jgi:hypothetical protein
MRVRLKGINCTRKKLANGEVIVYFYAWKGGPALRGQPGTPEFIQSYNEAIAQRVKPPTGTLLSVLQQYQNSEDFLGLADSTRRSYVALIKRIEKDFSDFPLSALADRRSRGVFLGWRDQIAGNGGRRQADYAWTVLARVLSWSFNRGLISANPCERPEVGCTGLAIALRKYGLLQTRLHSLNVRQHISTYRCSLPSGLDSDRATCCACPGRGTTERIFDCVK